MRYFVFIGLVLMAMALSGCKSGPDLVLWTDPWLEGVAEGLAKQYQDQYPGQEIEIVVRSSEVIAQSIKFGQPIDIFLSMDSRFVEEMNLKEKISEIFFMASDRVVFVECNSNEKAIGFGSENCLVLSASDRPLRRYTDEWADFPKDSCRLVADFPAQVKDYLARGWAKGGYIFESGALSLGPKVNILRKGPSLVDCASVIGVAGSANAANAKKFLGLCNSEKSKMLLVKQHFIP